MRERDRGKQREGKRRRERETKIQRVREFPYFKLSPSFYWDQNQIDNKSTFIQYNIEFKNAFLIIKFFSPQNENTAMMSFLLLWFSLHVF